MTPLGSMKRPVFVASAACVVAIVMGACGGGTSSGVAQNADAAMLDEASTEVDGSNPNLGTCVSTFGSGMTSSYGRLDGTLHAIVRPQDQQCAQPNGTHVDLEVEMNGAFYRLLIDVQSNTGTDVRVHYLEKSAPLPGDAWAEGWHTAGVALDYPSTFGVHTADLTPYTLADLTDIIVGEVAVGAKISIFTLGFGPDGGHDIHRNSVANADGAVVLGPDTASPKVLLFAFQDDAAF